MPLGPLPFEPIAEVYAEQRTVEGHLINSEIHELHSGRFGVTVEVKKDGVVASAKGALPGLSNDELEVWSETVDAREQATEARQKFEREAEEFIVHEL